MHTAATWLLCNCLTPAPSYQHACVFTPVTAEPSHTASAIELL